MPSGCRRAIWLQFRPEMQDVPYTPQVGRRFSTGRDCGLSLVPYKGIQIPGQRLDILVAGRIILKLKAVEAISPIHQAQLISYLKATGLRLGFLLNFKVQVLKDGIKRMVR